MGQSINWNGTDFSPYGFKVTFPETPLERLADSIQLQDKAYVGKGRAAPYVKTLPCYIEGTSLSNLNSNLLAVRGLLDQEEDCVLMLDGIPGIQWNARFSSLDGSYVAPTLWQGTLTFTMYDPKAFSTASSLHSETLGLNESASYGTTINYIVYNTDYVYVAAGQYVYKLKAIDLSLVATSADYGGAVYAIAVDTANGHVYIGGATTEKVRKLLLSDLTFVSDGPAYGGTIRCITESGSFIYYGGLIAAGTHMDKLLKSDMTTLVRSANHFQGTIYSVVVDSTYVYYAGDRMTGTNYVRRTDIATMATDLNSDDYTAIIRGLAQDTLHVYCVGEADKILKLTKTTMVTDTLSADLGDDLFAIAVDAGYVYAAGKDKVVRKCDIDDLTLLSSSADYGGWIYALAIDTVNERLFVGGATTQKVYKYDSRHMPMMAETDANDNYIHCMASDINFVYAAGSDQKVYKYRRSDMKLVGQSALYGGIIYAMAADSDSNGYLYIGGATTGKVWKLTKNTLTKVAESSVNYGGTIYAICLNSTGDLIYYGGGTYQKVVQYFSADLNWTGFESAIYGGDIRGICCNSTHVFAAGSTVQKIFKYDPSDMSKLAESASYGADIRALVCNDTNIFAAGGTINKVYKYLCSTLAKEAESETVSIGGTPIIFCLAIDDSHIYCGGLLIGGVWKIQISNMATIAKSSFYGWYLCAIAVGDGHIFFGGYVSYMNTVAWKCDKRVLWRRSDHEFTVTSAGTSRSNPFITITASADTYWPQVIENVTTDQELSRDGELLSGDVLEIDSDLWSIEREGVYDMKGQSGDWPQLAAGANTIRTEGIVGAADILWTDRFA